MEAERGYDTCRAPGISASSLRSSSGSDIVAKEVDKAMEFHPLTDGFAAIVMGVSLITIRSRQGREIARMDVQIASSVGDVNAVHTFRRGNISRSVGSSPRVSKAASHLGSCRWMRWRLIASRSRRDLRGIPPRFVIFSTTPIRG